MKSLYFKDFWNEIAFAIYKRIKLVCSEESDGEILQFSP